eukprot:6056707-Pyramimonas_sp.AAC.2
MTMPCDETVWVRENLSRNGRHQRLQDIRELNPHLQRENAGPVVPMQRPLHPPFTSSPMWAPQGVLCPIFPYLSNNVLTVKYIATYPPSPEATPGTLHYLEGSALTFNHHTVPATDHQAQASYSYSLRRFDEWK